MTAKKRYSILCDHWDGCVASFDGVQERASEARTAAAKYGWTYKLVPADAKGPMYSVDLCPVHST